VLSLLIFLFGINPQSLAIQEILVIVGSIFIIGKIIYWIIIFIFSCKNNFDDVNSSTKHLCTSLAAVIALYISLTYSEKLVEWFQIFIEFVQSLD